MSRNQAQKPMRPARFSRGALVDELRHRAQEIRACHSFDPDNGTAQLLPPLPPRHTAASFEGSGIRKPKDITPRSVTLTESELHALVDRAVAYGVAEAHAALACGIDEGRIGLRQPNEESDRAPCETPARPRQR